MIKVNKRNVIDVSDWDDLVIETYNKHYSFQQQDDCKERQIWTIRVPVEDPEDFENIEIPFVINGEEMGVKFDVWLNTTEKETEEKFLEKDKTFNNLFWERNFYPHIDMVINDLHTKGLLEAGEYDIKIDW